MENFLRKSIISLIFLSVLTPFIVVDTMFFPFITGKNFFFRFITEAMLFLWLILVIYKPQFRPKSSLISCAALIFTGVVFLADILAENPNKALWSNFERMEGFVTIAHLFVYFLVVGSVLNTEKIWLWFLRAYAGASLLMSAFATGQLFFNSSFFKTSIAGHLGKSISEFIQNFFVISQGGVRVDGRLGNAAYLAGFLLINIFLVLFLLYRDRAKEKKWQIFYFVTLVLNLFILYSTATRGAILGLFGGLFITAVLILIFEKKDVILKRIAMVSLALVIFSSLFVFIAKDSNFVKKNPTLSRLSSISVSGGDAQARFLVWSMAFQGFKERPILGWGQEGFNFVFNKYYDPLMYGREQWFDRTHNIFLDWLISGGILGLLSYLSLLVLLFVYIWKDKGLPKSNFQLAFSEKAILTGLVCAYAFHNIFVFDNIVSYLMFFSLLAFFHSARSVDFKKMDYKNGVSLSDVTNFYAPILLALFVLTVYFVNWSAYATSKDLIKALSAQKGGIADNLSLLKRALNRHSFANQEVREQVYQIAYSVNSTSANISQDIKSQTLSFAESELRKQVVETPKDARGYVFLGSLLAFRGSYKDSIEFFKTALSLSPKKQVIKMALADDYLKLGDKEEAFKYAEDAYKSKPQFQDLKTNYSLIALYSGKVEEAKKALIEVYGTDMPLDQRILKAYSDIGFRQKVTSFLWQNIEKSPTSLDLYILLAQLYLDAGQRQNAVDVLRNAIKNNPSFKEQGEAYIAQISPK
jgi:O-antigen ligase/Tfp pilus assembly protein PilF